MQAGGVAPVGGSSTDSLRLQAQLGGLEEQVRLAVARAPALVMCTAYWLGAWHCAICCAVECDL